MPQYAVDVWSLIHYIGWGVLVFGLGPRIGIVPAIILGICSGIAWELIEPLTVEVWFGFKEPWYNRWITDISADILGVISGAILAQIQKNRNQPRHRR
jgi:hypothetical protein